MIRKPQAPLVLVFALAFGMLWGGSKAMKTLPNVADLSLLFVGEVEQVGPEPANWSGRFAMHQSVRYRIVRPLKQDEKASLAKSITIQHPVVKNSAHARADRPGLSPEWFAAGTTLIVGAIEQKGEYLARYVERWDKDTENSLREAVEAQPAK